MRLTFRVTSSGDRWAVLAPSVDFMKVWPDGANFDEAEFRREIRRFDGLAMIGEKAGEQCAMRFGSVLLHHFDVWRGDCNDNEQMRDGGTLRRAQTVVDRRATQGRYGNVRVRIDPIVRPFGGKVYHTLRVRVDRDDRDVPNASETTHYCAMVLSYLLREIDRDLQAHGQPPCEIGDEVLAYAAERDREYYAARARESNAMRGECERNANGYCSPCKFGCPHYKAGRCVEVETLTDEATLMHVPHMAARMEQLKAERRNEKEASE